jgi:hypothetical protein
LPELNQIKKLWDEKNIQKKSKQHLPRDTKTLHAMSGRALPQNTSIAFEAMPRHMQVIDAEGDHIKY